MVDPADAQVVRRVRQQTWVVPCRLQLCLNPECRAECNLQGLPGIFRRLVGETLQEAAVGQIACGAEYDEDVRLNILSDHGFLSNFMAWPPN